MNNFSTSLRPEITYVFIKKFNNEFEGNEYGKNNKFIDKIFLLFCKHQTHNMSPILLLVNPIKNKSKLLVRAQ